jgi:hypothetical protein
MNGKLVEDRLMDALRLVQEASKEFVQLGFFEKGVLARLNLWVSGLPTDRRAKANEIARMAAKTDTGTGADINGVALDEVAKPSLESLVLHYDDQEPGLFPQDVIAKIERKLAIHRGPRYLGPWP